MRRFSLVAFVASLLVLLVASACQPPPPSRTISVSMKAEHFTGSSGIRVFTVPDPGAEFVAFHVRYQTGSVDDPVGKEGLAHFVEHLMFTRTIKLSGREMTIGSRIDELSLAHNAFTNQDVTHYFTIVPREHLGEMFAIETVRISTGCDGLSVEQFEREKEVVRNEIRTRSAGDIGKIHPAALQAFYGDHPYARPIGGSDESLQRITLADVCAFAKNNYAPSKVAFYVVGNVGSGEVRKLSIEWLGRVAARDVPPPKVIPRAELKPGKQTLTLDVEAPYVVAGWGVPLVHKSYPLLNEGMGVLSGRMNFFSSTYEIGNRVSITRSGGARAPLAMMLVQLQSESKFDAAITAIEKSADSVEFNIPKDSYHPFRRDMFDARSDAVEALLARFESPQNRGVEFANLDDQSSGRRFLVEEVEAIAKISSRDLSSMASNAFEFDKAAILYIKPSGALRAGTGSNDAIEHASNHWKTPADPALANSPQPLPALRPQTLVREDYRLSSGMRVILAPNGDLPLVRASLMFAVGSANEPDSRPGLANAAGAYQGGRVSSSQTVYLRRDLKTKVDVMIERLAYGKRGIRYNQERLEKARATLRRTLSRPSAEARRAYVREMSKRIYGADHPYAKRGHPELKDYDRINRDDLISFGRKHYGGASGTVIVTGQFDVSVIKQHIKKHFGHWEKLESPPPPAVANPTASGGVVTAVNPSATQLGVEIGYPGPRGVDDLYPARLVLASLIRGRLRSLREERGITYGATASYRPEIGPGRWIFQAQVDPTRATEGVEAIVKLVDTLRANSDAEQLLVDFVLARRQVVDQLLLERSLTASAANQLAFAVKYDLPLEYRFELPRLVAKVTPAQVREVLEAEISSERQVIGLLGSATAVAAGKRATAQ